MCVHTSSTQQDVKYQLWYLKKKLWKGGRRSIDISWTIPNDKVLAHFGIRSKVLPRGLTDIGAWVGFYTASPQQGVNYQLWYLIFFGSRRGSINIPWTIPNGKIHAHLEIKSNVLPGPLIVLCVWAGFCTSRSQQGVKYQLWYLKKNCGRGGSIKIPWKIINDKVFAHLGLDQRYCLEL